MKADMTPNGCTLTRERGDKRIAKESTVVFHMRNLLNSQGHNFRRIYPDLYGLTSCRLGLANKKNEVMLWHERYAIENAAEEFNNNGSVFFLRA